jgi:RNA-directed DNA polymerase
MSNTSLKTTGEWNTINWRKLERVVYKLQKRIYQASLRGDTKVVHRLQKTLMRSWSAKTLAVRKVTQDNQGKKTAGVDGVKSLTPKQRLTLVSKLRISNKSQSTRRVWIPKPGKDEKRPLGIPTMHDRATQALVKLTLEPEWEAFFEPNSYGFRPGRSAKDAIEAIFNSIRMKPKWVLDADITKCFDNIDHEVLIKKINTFPTLNRQIKAWLKAGVMDNLNYEPTDKGTPQGGVISPLLANIALHGMEEVISKAFPKLTENNRKTWYHNRGENFYSPQVIRYADDFVILHENYKVIERCSQIIDAWLDGIGLGINLKKSKITHTLNKPVINRPDDPLGLTPNLADKEGFNFLGFHIRQYKAGKYDSGKSSNGEKLGFKTLIKPSKEAIKTHYKEIARIINTYKAAPQEVLIYKLNPVIRGWSRYYSSVVSKEEYNRLDNLVFQRLWTWGRKRHSKKPAEWVKKKYWHSHLGNNWTFSTIKEGKVDVAILRHNSTEIRRHIKVKGTSSPFDGNLKYWSIRKGENPQISKKVATLLKKQKGKCNHCGLYFREEDLLEVDHIIPKSKGGKDKYDNLQLLHRHCHDVKTANDNLKETIINDEYLEENPW